MSLTFDLHRNPAPASDERRAAIHANPGFGLHFTDHMVRAVWTKSGGWGDGRVEPYGPIQLMPSAAVLSSVFAESDSFDPARGPAPGQRALDVIYLPYATQETTGIPEIPATDRPWLMFAGMPWAHVMLTR